MRNPRNRPSRQLMWALAIPPGKRVEHYGPPLLMSQEEVAYRLGISRTTLWRLVKTGELDPFHIGARTHITAESLDRFIERHSNSQKSK